MTNIPIHLLITSSTIKRGLLDFKIFRWREILSVVWIAIVFGSTSSFANTAQDWVVGFWVGVSDEDGSLPDIFEIRPNGKYITRGYDCSVNFEASYHMYSNDIYVTYEIPSKGPIATVFRPSNDRTKLSFTSPRTRKNAVYKKVAIDPCAKG